MVMDGCMLLLVVWCDRWVFSLRRWWFGIWLSGCFSLWGVVLILVSFLLMFCFWMVCVCMWLLLMLCGVFGLLIFVSFC